MEGWESTRGGGGEEMGTGWSELGDERALGALGLGDERVADRPAARPAAHPANRSQFTAGIAKFGDQ